MNGTVRKLAKHAVALGIVAAVVIGFVVAAITIPGALKARFAAQTAQAAQAQALNDGTTHDMTIVWKDGHEEHVRYREQIIPRGGTFTGKRNTHITTIDMFSFNPLDSANKAGERLTPPTFTEGDTPAIQIDENGVDASKTKGAIAVGEGGSNPVWGEYLGWGVVLIVGVVGIIILGKLWPWIAAEWKRIEPGLIGAISPTTPPAASPIPTIPAPPVT